MKFEKKAFAIKDLVHAWESTQLRRNPEYQRGETWTKAQQQCLIDSLFRKYPIPPLFLQLITDQGLGGEEARRYDVVDGQQRLLALCGYAQGEYPLLAPEDKKLRLPGSLRSAPAPWAKKCFHELSECLQNELLENTIDVYELKDVRGPDEVRDLFIRLQSGTALSRQQIRDAWPGEIGPYVERLAGKLTKIPKLEFFRLVDKRGTRVEDEDQKDRYVADRQTCAQLLRIVLSRSMNPYAFPSVNASNLDALYHEYTEFDQNGETAQHFESFLSKATKVVTTVKDITHFRGKKKTKFKKLELFSLVMLIQDLSRSPNYKMDKIAIDRIAREMLKDRSKEINKKRTSAKAIQEHYEWFRKEIGEGIGIQLDQRRCFNDDQKSEIYNRDKGTCAMCGEKVDPEQAEYDHFPTPYRDGGQTIVENGRLVHPGCHARGRPPEDR